MNTPKRNNGQGKICPICHSHCTSKKSSQFTSRTEKVIVEIKCDRCGNFNIDNFILETIKNNKTISVEERMIASSYIHYNNDQLIDSLTLFGSVKKLDPNLRIDKLLLFYSNHHTKLGIFQDPQFDNPKLYAATYSYDQNDVAGLIDFATESNFLEKKVGSDLHHDGVIVGIKIKLPGWQQIQHLRQNNTSSTQGFVAMWFDDSMTPIYDSTIAQAISQTGYTPHRVDRREHAGKVDDEIIAQIRRSKFVVADLTGHRGGVYYEAGFAHGLGLPVIMTCREDHLNELHFDIRQYNCILWKEDNLKEFQERLQNRIEAILGRGPLIHDTQ